MGLGFGGRGMGETTGMSRLTDADLDFVVETVASEAKDKARLKALVQEDESFRGGGWSATSGFSTRW